MIAADIVAAPALLGLKITAEEPPLSVVSLTASDPAGAAAGADRVVEVVLAVVVVLEDWFADAWGMMTSPPLDALQCTVVPGTGDPSSITFTDITAVWLVRILAGPPVIPSSLGYGRKVTGSEEIENPRAEIVSVVDPGTAGAIGSRA